jgi:Xaa-Pro aminopeptidase
MPYWERRDPVLALMRQYGLRGWLLMDFRGSNPLLWQVLGGMPPGVHFTRRTFAWIAASGDVTLLAHSIEAGSASDPHWTVQSYHNSASLRERLAGFGIAGEKVAMEYSPMGELPYVSRVDAGTLDVVRSLGAEVVTSADLLQLAIAQWDETQVEQHDHAAQLVDGVKNDAFTLVGERVGRGERVTEHEVSRFIEEQFAARGLATIYHPTVAVGPNSANPHYEPVEGQSRTIGRDEWVLIDLWARLDTPGSPYADVTWVAWTGPSAVPERVERVFGVVKRGRDLALERLRDAAHAGRVPQGWEIDRAVRDYIASEGFGDQFTHRTGHNLGPEEVHGSAGVCLDDFETHDTRAVLPRVAFSVEPGVYLPGDFGVRLELNAVMTETGPVVYTPVQDEIIRLI